MHDVAGIKRKCLADDRNANGNISEKNLQEFFFISGNIIIFPGKLFFNKPDMQDGFWKSLHWLTLTARTNLESILSP